MHQVPAGRVILVLGGEGKTHLVKDLARKWHVHGARHGKRGQNARNAWIDRVFCFGPRVGQEYGFVPPSCRHVVFSEQAMLDIVQSQGSQPPEHALVIVDGCPLTVLRSDATWRLFKMAEAAKVHVVVTGPHSVTLPVHLRARVDVCMLLHTHNWAHRNICFMQWGARAFESLRAFNRAFDSLTDAFSCMVLGKSQRVAWYRAAVGMQPRFRMGHARHWRLPARARAPARTEGTVSFAVATTTTTTADTTDTGECAALAYCPRPADRGEAAEAEAVAAVAAEAEAVAAGAEAPEAADAEALGAEAVPPEAVAAEAAEAEAAARAQRACRHSVRARDVDTRALAVVGVPSDTPCIARGPVCEWREHGVRSTPAPENVRFARVFCFTDQPDAFDFVPAAAHCGAFDSAALRALEDRQRCEWAVDNLRWDRRRQVLCIMDRCTALEMESGAIRDFVRTGALFGMQLVPLVDAGTVAPPTVFENIDTCFCARGLVPAMHAQAYHQGPPHLGTQVEREAALEALPDAHSCVVVEHAGPCLKTGVYYTVLPAPPLVHVPSGDDGAAGTSAEPSCLLLTQQCTTNSPGLPTAHRDAAGGAAAPAPAMTRASALFRGLSGSCAVM